VPNYDGNLGFFLRKAATMAYFVGEKKSPLYFRVKRTGAYAYLQIVESSAIAARSINGS